jgi:exodeoxyribonuclease V gamma subunit
VHGIFGDTVVRAEYSKLAPKHRLRAWVQVLALTAAQPARSWRASTIGRLDARVAGVSIAALSTPPAPRAREWLAELVSIRDRALREPLPVPVAPACEYAARRLGAAAEQQAFDEAGRRWQRDDVHHVRCWGPGRRLRQIAGVADADDLLAWPDEPTRFGTLSRRIWEPLLRHEHLQQRRARTG